MMQFRLRLPRRPPRIPAPRALRANSTFAPRPSPPKLPAAQQAEFERLQRAAAVSSAFQQPPAAAAAPATAAATATPPVTPPVTQQPRHATDAARPAQDDDADRVNRGLFRGAPPEFRGDVNPKTGEVGGPKNEPLRWGGVGDWSYNGRVADF